MTKRILLVGGGTGGHIFPLYNLCEALLKQDVETHLLVNDAELDKKIVQSTFAKLKKLQPHYLKAHKIHYHFAFSNLINWVKIVGSCWSARRLIKEVNPDVIFFKGGFVGFPVLIAAKWLTGFKSQIYLHDSDILPGALSKLFSKYADQTFSNFGDKPHPLFYWPSSLPHPGLDPGPSPDLPQILIFGGSQGAQFINDLIMANVDKLCEKYRVVLVAGPDKNQYQVKHPNLEIFGFLDQDKLIEQIFCSSLVISRAGASMFQVLAAKKPMIAIPLPTAARNHQMLNAQYFAEKGLCYLLAQNKDTHSQVLPMIETVLSDKALSKKLANHKTVPKTKEIVKILTL